VNNWLVSDMGMHKFFSQAIRFNGFTDGIVVPTGMKKESGINLLHPDYAGGATTTISHATKIGRIHLPTESNPLNRIMGAFTVEAFVVPNYGGVVVDKPKCFSLKVGDPFKKAPIEFKIHCIGRVFTLVTSFDVNILYEANAGTYTGGTEHKPNDLSEGSQPLLHINAQFTGREMILNLNGSVAARLDLMEERILDNVSSDMFIGGKGGEFRGIIESVRISKGIKNPLLQPFGREDDTLGLWDFNDQIDVPDLRFFNNRNESTPNQGRDGLAQYDAFFETPLVMLGYDFQNISDKGYFKVYDLPQHTTSTIKHYTALEKIASFATGIELNKIRDQTWYGSSLKLNASTFGSSTGTLDYSLSNRIPHSTLNAVVNQSATHPLTGLPQTQAGITRLFGTTTVAGIGNASDLDPVVNPIERIRIIEIDFANERLICLSPHLVNDNTVAATVENHPKSQGFIYDHADGTPIWLTLGNADLVIDPGNKDVPSDFIGKPATLDGSSLVAGSGYTGGSTGVPTTGGSGTGLTVNILLVTGGGGLVSLGIATPGSGYNVGETVTIAGGGGAGGSIDIATLDTTTTHTRQKDAFTRAQFTQGQMFHDRSGNNNTAYFVSTQSRMTEPTTSLLPVTSNVAEPDIPSFSANNLLMWLPVSGLSSVSDGDTISHIPDQSGNKFGVYSTGTWVYEAASASFNSQPALKLSSATGAWVNIDTDDGESEQLTTSNGKYTACFMINSPISTYDSSTVTAMFGGNGGTAAQKTFVNYLGAGTPQLSITNNSSTTTITSGVFSQTTGSDHFPALFIVTLDHTSQKAIVYRHGNTGVEVASSITSAVDFDKGLFAIFGKGVSVNTSAKTATSSNEVKTNFRFSEFALYEGILNETQRATVRGYFLDRYSVI
jgi:hypothetical protein